MLKSLAIPWMLLIVLGSSCGAEQVHAKEGEKKPTAPIATIPAKQQDANTLQSQEQNDIHADVKIVDPPQKDFYDKAGVWANLSLVVVAMGTGLVIGWQSVETRKAAEAALLNAQALIRAERPWIWMVIQPVRDAPNRFEVKAINRGRTPAMLVSGGKGFLVVGGQTEIPDVPQYAVTFFSEGEILFPDEPRRILEFSRDVVLLQSPAEAFSIAEKGDAYVLVFGNLVYRNLLEPRTESPHETRWCATLTMGENGDKFVFTRGRQGYRQHT